MATAKLLRASGQASAILVALILSIPRLSVALESGPSNTVGFWKVDVHPGYTQMSFPLLPADKSVNNVLGDQLTGGLTMGESDQVLRWNAASGQFQTCWYNTANQTWQGDFGQFSEAESYWIYVQANHPATQTIVTFGNVYEEPYYDMGTMRPGYNAIGSVWPVPAALSLAGLGGYEGGLYLFLSDLITSYDASTGSYPYAWQDGNGTWKGNLTQFEPLKGYWIFVAPGHPGFEWPIYPQPDPTNSDHRTLPLPKPVANSIGNAPVKTLPPTMPPLPNSALKGQVNTPAAKTSPSALPPSKGGNQ